MTAASWINRCLMAGVIVVIGPVSSLMAESVEAFTISTLPFTNPVAGVVPCNVDESSAAIARLSAEADGSTLETIQEQLNPQDLQDLSASIICSYHAAMMGVVSIPAVVIDQKYVVYGNTDMSRAVAEIDDVDQSHS